MTLKRRRAVRIPLNADVELSFLATRHVVEWRPTAATVPPNFYLGYQRNVPSYNLNKDNAHLTHPLIQYREVFSRDCEGNLFLSDIKLSLTVPAENYMILN